MPKSRNHDPGNQTVSLLFVGRLVHAPVTRFFREVSHGDYRVPLPNTRSIFAVLVTTISGLTTRIRRLKMIGNMVTEQFAEVHRWRSCLERLRIRIHVTCPADGG